MNDGEVAGRHCEGVEGGGVAGRQPALPSIAERHYVRVVLAARLQPLEGCGGRFGADHRAEVVAGRFQVDLVVRDGWLVIMYVNMKVVWQNMQFSNKT